MSSQIQDLAFPGETEGLYTAPAAEDSSLAMSPFQVRVHRCLCLLVVSLILEGIARKLAPAVVGNLIFFFKDFLTFVLLVMCIRGEQNAETSRLLRMMGILTFLLLPCLLSTAIHDPILAIFGLKQYALFPTVALAMAAAYLPNNRQQFFSMFRLIALSVIVTTLIAVAQNRLPASNWLNLSVGGDDLGGFSAGGYLRVSSTFSFCGQYCFYLNAVCFCLPVFFCLNQSLEGWIGKLLFVVLIGLFIAGTFLTGSRTSVLGNLVILSIGGLLAILFGGGRAIKKILIPALLGIGLLLVLQSVKPEFFAAYQTRMAEAEDQIDVESRISNDLFSLNIGSVIAPPTGLGYGLGIMSNGSDKLSAYAAGWRGSGFWTETDRATTLFEGGWYLMIVWYGLRLWIIVHSLILIVRMQSSEFRLIGSFAWAFVLVEGVIGPLAIQPPLAIWWWLAVGLIVCLAEFDREPLPEEFES